MSASWRAVLSSTLTCLGTLAPLEAGLRSARRTDHGFDLAAHADELAPLVAALAAAPALDAKALDRLVRRHAKRGGGLFRKSEIIAGFRGLGGTERFGASEDAFVASLRLRPVRTLSGVTPVTLLTKPYPCPGRCIFCPNDVRMPKSYLADEPGAQRAEDNRFDPYLQAWNRLRAYRQIGHPTSKIELIVLGGTWSHYPEPYQRWFVKRTFDALNDFGAGRDARAAAGAAPARWREALRALDGRALGGDRAYNRAIGAFLEREHGRGLLHASESATWSELEAAQCENESAGARCVGLSLETRPDEVDAVEALRMRRLGATKVQLGVQSLSDAVLEANRRGHDVAQTRRAFAVLRRFGFKLQIHYMLNLLGSTPEQDVAGFEQLFRDPDFQPDELKLYPCMLVASAELMRHYEAGDWRPYDDAELLDVVTACLKLAPETLRLSRVIRDFSSHDIVAGTHTANLREWAERRLAAEGLRCRDIRAREIRGDGFDADALELREAAFVTSIGEERFVSFETPDRQLVGFLRLLLPKTPAPHPELAGAALIREVHVYGASLAVGQSGDAAQHAGLGGRLVERAAEIAREAGYASLAVISAVGTREWYRRLGFQCAALYPRRDLGEVPRRR
ncbi:MAG: tRNA uridine(34) 5-carboxymethylaminomethyl modification radical SAM/GNAT enzyme Elp3 [Deltaproteobacteria bacterium]|nr:tRNA uridine(34) 5-carboxymethylaminomethyl modification radical SAM/GNAT enzyme Elp3 [Deltaproteobacteria bacterium]